MKLRVFTYCLALKCWLYLQILKNEIKMKIKKYLSLLLLLTFLTTTYGQKKKVAVVTFYANKMVEFKELGIGSEELIKDVLDLRDNPNFNLAPLLEQFHSNFFNEYATAFPFELLPESSVVDTEKYLSLKLYWRK